MLSILVPFNNHCAGYVHIQNSWSALYLPYLRKTLSTTPTTTTTTLGFLWVFSICNVKLVYEHATISARSGWKILCIRKCIARVGEETRPSGGCSGIQRNVYCYIKCTGENIQVSRQYYTIHIFSWQKYIVQVPSCLSNGSIAAAAASLARRPRTIESGYTTYWSTDQCWFWWLISITSKTKWWSIKMLQQVELYNGNKLMGTSTGDLTLLIKSEY